MTAEGSRSFSASLHNAAVRADFDLRRLVHGSLRRLGVDIVRYDAARFPELRRGRLLAEGGISVVLDVGANDGSFGRALRAAGYEGRIVSFEPQSAVFPALAAASGADPRWTSRRIALGSRASRETLHVAANTSSSSLLPMTARHESAAPESRYVGDEAVDVVRLDDIRDEVVEPADRVYLKIDVQGGELEVLRGAEETLRQVVLVDVELSFVPLYEGAPLYDEVLRQLESHGFGVLSLEPVLVDPEGGRLLQVDAILGRSEG